MEKRDDSPGVIAVVVLLLILLIALFYQLYNNGVFSQLNLTVLGINSPSSTTTVPANTSYTTTSISPTSTAQTTIPTNSSSLYAYTLSLINKDRQQYGLQNVTLSSEASGQQHAQNMLELNYLSHWDTYGMTPYMRYTLLNGTGAVSENIAYRYGETCVVSGCTGNVDVKAALEDMEHEMMYNDSACCNDEHRSNILDQHHNQVSIGIAYNSSTVYLVEDFIDNYISWKSYGPDAATDEMYLSGSTNGVYPLSSILISYDSPVQNMSRAQLNSTRSYGSGTEIAGVVSNNLSYYPELTTIVADKYSVSGRQFSVAFNVRNLTIKNGAGEYTVVVFLNDTKGISFVGSTYTIFVGNDGRIYVPTEV